MSGLIVKDLRLIMQKKRFFVLLLILAVLMRSQQDGMFAVSYLTFLAAILSIGTVSYDELDNGYVFLLTLPVSRRVYVREKYLFGAVVGAVGWLIGCLILCGFLFETGRGSAPWEYLAPAPAILPFALLLVDIMLPIQLKFGAEQGRLVLFLVIGILTAAVGLCIKLLPREGIFMEKIMTAMSGMNAWVPVAGFAVFVICATLLSYRISLHVMEKKEL